MELIENVIKDFQEIKAKQIHDGNYVIFLCNSENEKIIVGRINDDEVASQIFEKNAGEITEDDWEWYDEQLGTFDKESYAKKYWNEAVVKRGHLRDSIRIAIENLNTESTNKNKAFLAKLKAKY